MSISKTVAKKKKLIIGKKKKHQARDMARANNSSSSSSSNTTSNSPSCKEKKTTTTTTPIGALLRGMAHSFPTRVCISANTLSLGCALHSTTIAPIHFHPTGNILLLLPTTDNTNRVAGCTTVLGQCRLLIHMLSLPYTLHEAYQRILLVCWAQQHAVLQVVEGFLVHVHARERQCAHQKHTVAQEWRASTSSKQGGAEACACVEMTSCELALGNLDECLDGHQLAMRRVNACVWCGKGDPCFVRFCSLCDVCTSIQRLSTQPWLALEYVVVGEMGHRRRAVPLRTTNASTKSWCASI